ncbi:hypothetical protein FGB62_169g313 [Gracilaria domingensis]|nr:hypothetical protein FGB62_169g312 [Gracilaria domingensis]KAI0559071.1 hypothetical protein FGB62_169g313 [Gracilaria domingensis]
MTCGLPASHLPPRPLRRVSKRDFATMLHGEDDVDCEDDIHREDDVHRQHFPSLPLLVSTRAPSRSRSPKRRRLQVRFRDEPRTQPRYEQVASELVTAATYTHRERGGHNLVILECSAAASGRADVLPTATDARHQVLRTADARELESTATHSMAVNVHRNQVAARREAPLEPPTHNLVWSTNSHYHAGTSFTAQGIQLPPPPLPVTAAEMEFARDLIVAASQSRRDHGWRDDDVRSLSQRLRAFQREFVAGLWQRRRGRTMG